MKHAKLSPSASARWLACPGSVSANWGKPHTNNKYSLEGTAAHTLLEASIITGISPERFVGSLKGVPVTVEMADAVTYALEWVAGYMGNNPGAKMYSEQKVHYSEAIGAPPDHGFGYPDIQLDNYPHELVTLDYKHGVGITVHVDDNSQLKLYHAGKRQERGRYRKYRSVVVQPRARGRKPVHEAVHTDKELMHWLETVVKPVVPIALSGPTAPRKAGEHCRYCAASGSCPAQYELVQAAAKKEFGMKNPKA